MPRTANIVADATLLSEGAASALRNAEASAGYAPDGLVTSTHLLHALLKNREAVGLLTNNNVDARALYLETLKRSQHPSSGPYNTEVQYADELSQLLETAAQAIAELGQSQIDGATLLIVMVGRGQGEAAELLLRFGLAFESAVQSLRSLQESRQWSEAAPSPGAENEEPTEDPGSGDAGELTDSSRRPLPGGRIGAAPVDRQPVDEIPGRPAAPPESPAPSASRRIGSGRGGINENTGSAGGPIRDTPQSDYSILADPFASPQPPRANRRISSGRRVIDPGGMGFGDGPEPDHEAFDVPEAAGAQEPQSSPDVTSGKLVENIPRTMTAFVPVTVEARIAREESEALYRDLAGPGAVQDHEVHVTQAMTMQLRAPHGGFTIESGAPETQWIENRLGIAGTNDFGSWRWSVTPTRRGSNTLQLVVAARTVDPSGLVAESPLPDQIIEVRVAINYARQLGKVGGWGIAAVAGGVLAKYGETAANWLLSRL